MSDYRSPDRKFAPFAAQVYRHQPRRVELGPVYVVLWNHPRAVPLRRGHVGGGGELAQADVGVAREGYWGSPCRAGSRRFGQHVGGVQLARSQPSARCRLTAGPATDRECLHVRTRWMPYAFTFSFRPESGHGKFRKPEPIAGPWFRDCFGMVGSVDGARKLNSFGGEK